MRPLTRQQAITVTVVREGETEKETVVVVMEGEDDHSILYDDDEEEEEMEEGWIIFLGAPTYLVEIRLAIKTSLFRHCFIHTHISPYHPNCFNVSKFPSSSNPEDDGNLLI